MKPLFVDTTGWMACVDAADPARKPARAARDQWSGREAHFAQFGFEVKP